VKTVRLIKNFLVLAVLVSAVSAQDFSVTLTFSGEGQSRGLTVGFSPSATDGYDAGYCSNEGITDYDGCLNSGAQWILDAYAPPAPPPPAFDAALSWSSDRYFNQILLGDGVLAEHVYDIQLSYPSDNLITVTWDNTNWDALMSSFLLQDAFGGIMINVDMLTETTLTLNNPAFTGLKLKVTPNNYSVPVPEFSVNNTSGSAGSEFIFSDNSTAGTTEIAGWFWDFGDGTSSVEQNPVHVYDSVAVYSVGLTVTDENSFSRSIIKADFVTVEAAPPVADAGPDQNVNENVEVTLDGSSSVDPDGEIVSYLWEAEGVSISNAESSIASFIAPEVSADTSYVFSLTVTDNDANTVSDSVIVTVVNVLIPPTASAGADIFVDELLTYQLDGSSSSDSNGTLVSYLWSSDNTSVTFDDNSSVAPTVLLPEVSDTTEAVITLTVVDNDGQESSDNLIITINNVLIAPVANAGSDGTIDEELIFTLDGSGSYDPNGTIESYLWTAPPEIIFDDPTTVSPSFTAPEVDEHTEFTISLTVVDNDGQTASDDVVITVNNLISGVPVADAGIDQAINEGLTVTLDGTSSADEPPGQIVSYNWTSPPEITLVNPDSSMPSFSAPLIDLSQVSYSFSLTVIDNEGQESPADNVVITIMNVLIAPVADAGEDVVVNELVTVQLDGEGSADSNGEIQSFLWTSPDEISLDNPTLISPSFSAPEVSGDTDFFLSLTVTDNDNQSHTDSVNISILNVLIPPVADAGADTSINELVTFQLNGSQSTDPNGSIMSFSWQSPVEIDLNDSTLTNPTFSAPEIGVGEDSTYTFILSITDNDGQSDSDTVYVEVKFVNQPPVAVAGSDGSLLEGLDVLLDGSSSSDPDGQSVFYQWVTPEGVSFSEPNGAQPRFLAPQVDSDTTFSILLVISDGDLSSQPDTVNMTVLNNTAPTASAGADQQVYQGNMVTLNGASSSDLTDVSSIYGDITYRWTSLEGLTLSDSQDDKPTFTAPNVSDTTKYHFTLIVGDGEFSSAPDTVAITVLGNVSPVANAGGPQTVVEGHEVTLSGSGSSDSNNDEISFEWNSLDMHVDELSSLTAERPRFFAPSTDDTSAYRFTLRVSDGVFESELDTVVITVITNTPPVADAGNDDTVYQGEEVTLRGGYDDDTDVSDVYGDVEYSWTSHNGIELSDSAAKRPDFTAPVVGDTTELVFSLSVFDGEYFSNVSDSVTVTVLGNAQPVSKAGGNQQLVEGSLVQLDGSSSSDINGDELTYHWAAPDGITLSDSTIQNPEFFLPVTGSVEFISYAFSLVVNDGNLDSDPDEVIVKGKANEPPTVALDSIEVDQGTTVTLSPDVDDDFTDDLIFMWDSPSALIFDSEGIETPTFTAPDRDEATAYEVILTVSDGDTMSAPDTMVVTILENKPPSVTAGALDSDGSVVTDILLVDQGTMVTLDGTGSSDPNNDQLSYEWALLSSADPEDLNGVWNEGEQWTDELGNGVWDEGEEFVDCSSDQSICEGDSGWEESLGNGLYDTGEPFADLGNGMYDVGEPWVDYKLVLQNQGQGVRPTFIAPDMEEVSYYVFYLVVNDGEFNSVPGGSGRSPNEAKVSIKVLGNKAPFADAGEPKRGLSGNTIFLNGSASSDPNNDPLSYSWTPLDGSVFMSDLNAKKPSFVLPETNGEDRSFTFLLSVSDDEGKYSEVDTVIVTAMGGLPEPPTPPNLNVTSDHGVVTLTWDKSSELSLDPFTGYADFEGYRVYRSTDGGSTWGGSDDKIYDYNGNFVSWKPIAQFDLTEEQDSLRCLYSDQYTGCEEKRGVSISGFDPLAQRVSLGSNVGLNHSFVDSSVVDGIEYTYVVTSYDMGLRTYTTEFFDDDGDGIYRDSTIWSNSNPLHFVSWDEPSQSEIGLPSFESPFGSSAVDPNFVQVIPGYYASNITFPDPKNVVEFIVPEANTIGNGDQFYTIVEESNLTDALYHIEIQAELIMNDLNGDGIIENTQSLVEALNVFEGLPTENPSLYIYEIIDDSLREPVAMQDEILLSSISLVEQDSLLDLPGAQLSINSIQLPDYKLDGFPLRYLDDVDYRSNWTDFFDGIRLRFDNAINEYPNPPNVVISNQFSLPDSNLIDILYVSLEYVQDAAVFYKRPAYKYRIDFSSGVLDTARSTNKPSACEDRPGFYAFLPFRITNLTTGKHVPLAVLDNGIDNEPNLTEPDPGERNCNWERWEEIQFRYDEITTALGSDERLGTEDDALEYPEYTFNLSLGFDQSIYFLTMGSVPERWESSRQYGKEEYVSYQAMVYQADDIILPGIRPTDWYDSDGNGETDNPWKPVYPWKDGDYIIIEPTRWYVDGDSWTADLSKLGQSQPVTKELLEKITVVPNPYLAQSRFESLDNPDHRLRFTNLPQECKISIFTMTGELVKTINHYDEYNSNEWWNLANDHGQMISPGLYIYVVEAPSLKYNHIGKFVVVR
tara:strand:- start:18 stop:7340 length:7323 start_codon:yes stop_codon:yes gene_type:complete